MDMYYVMSENVTILFAGWKTTSAASYYPSLAALFFLSVTYEFLVAFRTKIVQDDRKKRAEMNACERQEKQSWVKDNLVILKHSVLYTINFIIAYFIMLCVMTFNGGISISIFLGIFIGNFLFSRLNSSGLQCDVEEKVAGCH